MNIFEMLVSAAMSGGGGGSGTDAPTIGFVPSAWDSSGYITDGTWYGASIPKYAFYNYSTSYMTWRFSNISLPDDLDNIGESAFNYCANLAITKFPDGLTVIGNSAFNNCTGLTSMILPAGLISIGSFGFAQCTGLTSVTFKGKPNSIYYNAFNNCHSLTVINVPWSEGEVSSAPWGATNATINYNYTGE